MMISMIPAATSDNLFEVLVLSCDSFEDIWGASYSLLSRNWPEKVEKATMVTESRKPSQQPFYAMHYSGEVCYADKIKTGLENIRSKYVLVLLDDYLLSKRIDDELINSLVREANEKNVDYVRFGTFRGEKKSKGSRVFYNVDLSNHHYEVNMQPSIWKTEALLQVLQGQKTAWELEVSMTKIAEENRFTAFSVPKKFFPYLDTIRKGNILRKAWRFLHKNNLYHGQRKKCPWKQEARLNFITFFKATTPVSLQKKVKAFLVKKGHHYYSD